MQIYAAQVVEKHRPGNPEFNNAAGRQLSMSRERKPSAAHITGYSYASGYFLIFTTCLVSERKFNGVTTIRSPLT
jgi:hypothetical protein